MWSNSKAMRFIFFHSTLYGPLLFISCLYFSFSFRSFRLFHFFYVYSFFLLLFIPFCFACLITITAFHYQFYIYRSAFILRWDILLAFSNQWNVYICVCVCVCIYIYIYIYIKLCNLTQILIKKLQLKDKSFITATYFGFSYRAIFRLSPKNCNIN